MVTATAPLITVVLLVMMATKIVEMIAIVNTARVGTPAIADASPLPLVPFR